MVVVSFLALAALPAPSAAADVTLAWEPNQEADLKEYRVSYGLSSGNYTVERKDVGKAATYRISGLRDGVSYYFAVRAVDINGNVSGYSNEVVFPERLTTPTLLTGPTAVADRIPRSYATGGAESSGNHPLEYRFLWADGTASAWLPAGQVEASRAWSIPGAYGVRSQARCAKHPGVRSLPSNPLEVSVVAAPGEVIPVPDAPSGPGDARTGVVYGYTSGGESSTFDDPLQYRFQWGDGSVSPWLSPDEFGAVKGWKSWSREGVYSVVAEARCAVHPSSPAASSAMEVAVAGGDSLRLADSFADGTAAGDPQWRTLSGRWLVGADKTFASAGLETVNRAVVRALPEFTAGRLSTKISLSRGSLAKSAGVVFALRDTRRYRYVTLSGSRIVIGQVGDTPGEGAGVKAAAARTTQADRWYRLRVDIRPDGGVFVYLGNATKPALAYRFADTVAGSVGCLAERSVSRFDDFRVWDARALR